MKVTHDVAVKTGSYTDSDGNTKGRYENVGKVFEKEDGGRFITLKRTFNPAGVPNPEDRDSVILSIFPVKERNGEQPARQQQTRQQPARQQQAKPQQNGDPFSDMGDDIPF